MEEMGDSSVSSKSEHHARIGCHGEKSTVPDADHDEAHQNHRSVVAEYICEDLDDWLSKALRSDCASEILDGEE